MHDPGELSAHALGLLGGAQARAVEQHLADCAACRREWSELRETAAVLDSVPPEMFLDGPPGNDLVRQRTLRQIRSETGRRRNCRRFGLAVAAGWSRPRCSAPVPTSASSSTRSRSSR